MLGSILDFTKVMSDNIQASSHRVYLVSKVVDFSDDVGVGVGLWVVTHWISVSLHVFYSGVLGASVVLWFYCVDCRF